MSQERTKRPAAAENHPAFLLSRDNVSLQLHVLKAENDTASGYAFINLRRSRDGPGWAGR